MIKKVNTYKFGPFVFSLNYDRNKLREPIVKAKVLYNSIRDVPILPKLAANLEEELIKRSIFGTAAIEGNPLSEEAVKKVLSEKEVSGKIEKAEKQIRNLKVVYNFIKNIKPIGPPMGVKESLVKSFHKLITMGSEDIKNIPGQYRNEEVKVGDKEHGGIYKPPKIFDDINALMKHFIDWINSPEVLREDNAIRAALAHYHIALIHPFYDGNGRTARAVEALLLKVAGIKYVPHMLSNFYYRNIDEYFLVFSRSERNNEYNITPFLEFFLKGLVDSLEEIQAVIFGWIRNFTLKDYYIHLKKKKKITQRQLDLLNFILDSPMQVSLKDLFNDEKLRVIYRDVTERTARRDLKGLLHNKLIREDGSGKFILNKNVLG